MAIIKGFIFDLDGVLVDTARYHYQAWKRLANTIGIDFSEKDNEQLKGVGRRESLLKILEWGDKEVPEDELEELMQQKNEWYQELIEEMDESSTLPGVREFLERAEELNLRLGLGSASKNAPKILEQTQLEEYFEVIIDGSQITKSKPDPQIFQLGAKKLELEPEALVVFEDARSGIEAAINGGFRTVGIGKKKNLSEAEIIFSGLADTTPAEVINQLNF